MTYLIAKELNKTGIGFKYENFLLELLFYADDGVLITQSTEETSTGLEILEEVVKEFGLEINVNKSSIIVYNVKDKPNEVKGNKVEQQIKYLDAMIRDKTDCFRQHKKIYMINRANNIK